MKTIKGNILDINHGIIVHGCNGLGVMGGGIALQIKERFPEAYKVYVKHHRSMGTISFAEVSKDKYIVNGVTQKVVGSGKQVSYDAIEEVFIRTVALQQSLPNILPICFPMIGAGLGGGNWGIIKVIIEQTIPDNIDSELYIL